MESTYNLQPNEYILKKEYPITHGMGPGVTNTSELLLTNINLVCVEKGLFGKLKQIYVWPLRQIKINDGKPQAIVGLNSYRKVVLEVYFWHGCESFLIELGSKKKTLNWAEAVCGAVEGTYEQSNDDAMKSDIYGCSEMMSEMSETIAEPFKAVGEVYASMGRGLLEGLGVKTKKKEKPLPTMRNSANDNISRKCSSCSAPLTGKRGQIVKCKYCDTKQTL